MNSLLRGMTQLSLRSNLRATKASCSTLIAAAAGQVVQPIRTAGRCRRYLPTVSYLFSTEATTATVEESTSSSNTKQQFALPTGTTPQVYRSEDGRTFAAFDMQKHPKLKPYIIKRRLNRMRTYDGAEKNIRHSPWRLNLICRLVAGLPLEDALTQLKFCNKSRAPLVGKVLKRTALWASKRDGLQPSQLEVAECFATKGRHLKRLKIMGRGRAGIMQHKFAHMRVVLREIDFKLRIYQAKSLSQKKKWFMLQQRGEREAEAAEKKRRELEELEKQAEEALRNKKK